MRACLYLLAALLLGACSPADEPPGSLQLGQYAGRWVVINYWATWCKPCIQEIPELNTLDKQYPQVTVLGVNYDGASGEELRRQAQELGIAFTMLATDPATALGVPRPVVLPTTLIIGPDGKLRHTLVGPQTLQSLAEHTSRGNDDG